jgi:hypothetical protein
VVEEDCAELVVDVCDGLSVASVSCLMGGNCKGGGGSNEEGAYHTAEERKGYIIRF